MNIKKYLVIIAVVLILGLVIFFVVKKIRTGSTSSVENAQQAAIQAQEIKLQEEKKYQADMQTLNKVLDRSRETDSDLDGLSNDEEKKLGTNPNDPDTDHDGVLDGDEVKKYHTNPLKADTDGDGYKDGDEIRSGYNPLGPGKLK